MGRPGARRARVFQQRRTRLRRAERSIAARDALCLVCGSLSLGSQSFEQLVEQVAGIVEPLLADETPPALFDLGDAYTCGHERLVATVGRHDQLGPSVATVR